MATTIETGTTSYTHYVCPSCGTLLCCSEAVEWMTNLIDVSGATEQVDDVHTGVGECPHLEDEDSIPVYCWTRPPRVGDWHRCQGGESDLPRLS